MEFSEGNEGPRSVLCLQPYPLPSLCLVVSLPPASLTPDPAPMSLWSLAVVRKMWQVPSMAYYFSTFHTVFGTAKDTPLLQVPEISVEVSAFGTPYLAPPHPPSNDHCPVCLHGDTLHRRAAPMP